MSARTLASASSLRLSELQVDLAAVLDCRDPTRLGLNLDGLCDDLDYRLPQRLAAVARARGAEGLLVPSATRLGHNLVVFTDRLQPKLNSAGVEPPRPHLFAPAPDRPYPRSGARPSTFGASDDHPPSRRLV
jgi:hypothetical protein